MAFLFILGQAFGSFGWWLWRAGCISQDTYLLYDIIGRPDDDGDGGHDDGNDDDDGVDDDTSPPQPAADDVRLQASRVKLPS